MRWGEIHKKISDKNPETPPNSIHGAMQKLFANSADILKVARGTYQMKKFVAADDALATVEDAKIINALVAASTPDDGNLTEQDFYASFAKWLEENDEATVASSLGGASLGGKWGTPDVIGVLKPRAQDIFKFESQIVTAEIKVTPSQPVVAFGQAVAYRLFSHKSYIVLPNSTGSDDMSRLKSLCSLHGVGLVTFTLDRQQPDYSIVVQATNATPDMFYVNSMLERLKENQPKILNHLFS